MNIFTKDCPACTASHPIHATRCGCGYCFAPEKSDSVTQDLEAIAQEERLYRDYLAARAEQAHHAWQVARTAAAIDPFNTIKAAEALRAKQVALAARAELEAQDARAKTVGARIKVVRSNDNRRRRAPLSNAAAGRAPTSVRAALAPPSDSARPSPSVPAARTIPHGLPRSATPVASQTVATPIASRTVVTTPTAAATPAPTITPTSTSAFRTTQANKAARAAPPATSKCQNCGATLAANASRCRCGYEIPVSASQIPPLSMSAEDRAAFQAALAPLDTGKNKR